MSLQSILESFEIAVKKLEDFSKHSSTNVTPRPTDSRPPGYVTELSSKTFRERINQSSEQETLTGSLERQTEHSLNSELRRISVEMILHYRTLEREWIYIQSQPMLSGVLDKTQKSILLNLFTEANQALQHSENIMSILGQSIRESLQHNKDG